MAAARVAYDLIVLGAGSGGLEAAWTAAVVHKQKVAVVEPQVNHGPPNFSALGGTCVNVGCVPKKLFMTGANFREAFRESKGFGWQGGVPGFDWKTMLAAKNKAVADINESYVGMLKDANIDFLEGWGKMLTPTSVGVSKVRGAAPEQTFDTKHTLLAVGSWPHVPTFPGSDLVITSNEAFYLPELPKRAVVIGGGYIAVEFASIFNGFGSQTTLVYRQGLPLRGFDNDCRKEIIRQMGDNGVNFKFEANVAEITKGGDGVLSVKLTTGETLEADVVMYATGRKANLQNLGLEDIGVKLNDKQAVAVDAYGQTNVPTVYALGDCTDRVMLTPVAIHEARCFIKTLYEGKPSAPDHERIASAVFSIPQHGACGLTEEAAAKQYPLVAVYSSTFEPLMQKLTGLRKKVVMKVVVDHATQEVVGVHVVSSEAGELIQAIGICLKMRAKKSDFDNTIGVHPTSAEELCSLSEPAYYLINGEKKDKLPSNL